MELYKRLGTILLSLLIIMMLLPMTVFSAGSIDLNRDVSLAITYQDDGTPLVGAEFDIYLVATVNEHIELTPTGSFNQFNVDLKGKSSESWRTLASTLEGYVLRDNITPAGNGKTDTDGLAFFPTDEKKLIPGLYLVTGKRHLQGGYRYDALPFMAMLPTQDKDTSEWIYDLKVNSKHDSVPDNPATITRKVLKVWKDKSNGKERPKEIIVQLLRDDEVFDTVVLNAGNSWRHTWTDLDDRYKWTVVEKELENYIVEVIQEGTTFVVTNTYKKNIPYEPTQKKPTLPQTGQLWWPVPLLLCTGLLFVVIGLISRRGAADEK
ncbi:MAG: Cna B-type domain-containing protein [Saccharofermentanales bacterium]|jgi:hypothetical protein|nr:Cna B-type domain-containing protein [Bacillota bacterium]NLB09332.1 Cna B-type domain-containing protein [Clostridiales bacterium]